MGDVAEMMLDGTLCEGCGAFLDGESPDHPRYCSVECADGRCLQYTPPKSRVKQKRAIGK